MKQTISEQPSPWRKSSKRESCYGDRVGYPRDSVWALRTPSCSQTVRRDYARHVGLVRYGTVRYGTVWHDTTRHDTTRHGTARHDTTRHDTTWHDMLLARHGVARCAPRRSSGHPDMLSMDTRRRKRWPPQPPVAGSRDFQSGEAYGSGPGPRLF